jgi:hypothetical protein
MRRRAALKMLGMAAAATAVAARATNATLQDPGSRLRVLRALQFQNADGPLYWWLKGVRYGQIDSVLTPFFALNVLTIMSIKTESPTAFTVRSLEVIVNTDLTTGAPVARWRNPYTSEELAVRVMPLGPAEIRYTAAGMEPPAGLPGARLESSTSIGPVTTAGDDIWIRSDTAAVATPLDGASPPFRVNDLAEYHGRVAEVMSPQRPFVSATVAFTAVTGWQRWMRMADRAGGCVVRASGRKARRYGDVPSDIRALVAEAFPAIHADPLAALAQPPFKFER